jgi:hypothetical protein
MNKKNWKKIEKLMDKAMDDLEKMSPEEREKYFPKDDNIPLGWVSIEDALPMWMSKDIIKGYSVYKVKDKNGDEFDVAVSDHNIWYHYAKKIGITHWWNE